MPAAVGEVVPIEEAFPRGLFEPFDPAAGDPPLGGCREHLFGRGEVLVEVSGIPRALPALKCERCPAILFRDVRP